MNSATRALVGGSCALVLASCASMIPTLAPGLHEDAVAYNTAISDINDRVLLANIVRARDEIPLNITELSTVTGSLSAQATLGVAAPFGGNYGTTPRGTATTGVQLGTAPTFSMAALNTRGFTLNIIQPISPVYVASKWNTGISHELLMLLFVKDIQFADSFVAAPGDCAHASPVVPDAAQAALLTPSGGGQPLIVCHHKFINDPDAPGEERAFRAVVEQMLPTMGIKVMTILEPVGPAFPFLPPPGAATAGGGSAKDGKLPAVASPLNAYDLATKLGDASYHVGNSDKGDAHGQLYRIYTNQVAVCAADPVKTADGAFYIYPVGADISSARQAQLAPRDAARVPLDRDVQARLDDFKAQCALSGRTGHTCTAVQALGPAPMAQAGANSFGSYAVVRSAAGSGLNAAGEGEAAGATEARALTSVGIPGHAMTEVSSSLQHNRVGALLRVDDCYADQTIRDPISENEFHKFTETLGHIEWRSVAEVFQYLGAVLRQPGNVTWHVLQDRDIVGSTSGSAPEAMFVLRQGAGADSRAGLVRLEYGAQTLAVGSGPVQLDGKGPLLDDQSLLVLSLLSELVNSAKISSDIPGTQQLQVLP